MHRNKTAPQKIFIPVFVVSLLLMFFPLNNRKAYAVTDTPTPTATSSPCASWNLANDFRAAPDQENPNRDSCNITGVWKFMTSSSLSRNPATYSLLPAFTPSFWGLAGLDAWMGSGATNHVVPAVGFNSSGVTKTYSTTRWYPNVVWAHPGSGTLAVIGWNSPVNGYVSVSGSVSDNDSNCGDGLQWYVDKGSTNIASGVYNNGGSQALANGTGGAGLNVIAVSAGDLLYLVLHPRGSHICDTTSVNISINVTNPPTSTPTLTPTATATNTSTPTPATPTPRSSGSGPCWASSGYSWPSYSAIYRIDTSIPTSWINSIDNAANAWINVTPSPFIFVNSPNTPNNNNTISLGYVENYGVPAYTAQSYAGSTLLQTYAVFNDQRTFDTNIPPAASSFSVQGLMTHEFGHWLALHDVYGSNCFDETMFPGIATGESRQITLETEDENGINWLYP